MTTREKVRELLAQGNGYHTVAKKLGISKSSAFYHASDENRVKFHRRRQMSKERFVQSLRDKLGAKCSKCGYDKYQGNLHFHHKDPSQKLRLRLKNGNWLGVTRLVENSTIELAEKEASKCVLLCANCHGELHYDLRNADKQRKPG